MGPGLIYIVLVWVLPSALAGGVVALIVAALNLLGLKFWAWIMLAPTLYFVWLVTYLWLCGLGLRAVTKRFPKPRRAVLPDQIDRMRGVSSGLVRMTAIESLPLARFLRTTTWGGRLVTRSYSPSMNVGKGVNLATPNLLVDPDITEIGDNVVMGNGVTVAAHFLKMQPDGKRVYITAPVKIGARTTIGAFSTVSLGCTIGEDSIVEPHSYLAPYTSIPSFEVWGGRPAAFLRKLSSRDAGDSAAGQEQTA